MVIHLDTSVLIDAFTGSYRSMPAIIDAVSEGEVLSFSTIVLYEWLRGPRTDQERSAVSSFFASEFVAAFGEPEAETAARLYQQVKRARQRQADLAIAACAIEHGAVIWTLNPDDFEEIPGLRLYRP
jgi:predicted nucleic acid-binding protein